MTPAAPAACGAKYPKQPLSSRHSGQDANLYRVGHDERPCSAATLQPSSPSSDSVPAARAASPSLRRLDREDLAPLSPVDLEWVPDNLLYRSLAFISHQLARPVVRDERR